MRPSPMRARILQVPIWSPTESVIALIVLSLSHQEMDWERLTGHTDIGRPVSGLATILPEPSTKTVGPWMAIAQSFPEPREALDP